MQATSGVTLDAAKTALSKAADKIKFLLSLFTDKALIILYDFIYHINFVTANTLKEYKKIFFYKLSIICKILFFLPLPYKILS